MKATFGILSLVCSLSLSGATKYYVAENGDDSAVGDADHPFKTIARALTAAISPYDEVLVADGTYALTEPLAMNGNLVTLRSLSGDRTKVIVDAQGKTNCLYMTQNGTIRDMTFVNGRAAMNVYKWQGTSSASDLYAGGIYCKQKGAISNCVVRACYAYGDGVKISGGGIYGYQTVVLDTLVEDCRAANTSTSTAAEVKGGGIYNDNWTGSPGAGMVAGCTVRNCSVAGRSDKTNIRTVIGGGVFVDNAAVVSNTIVENCAAHLANSVTGAYGASGGGIAVRNGGQVMDSFLSGCAAEVAGGGLYAFDTGSQVSVVRCRFEANRLESVQTDYGDGGAAAYTQAADALFAGCVFCANTNAYRTYNGSGILMAEGRVTVRGCLFEKNRSKEGSGMFVSAAADSVIRDCLFRENVTDGNGGVIAAYQPDGVLVDRSSIISNVSESANTVMVRVSNSTAAKEGITFRNSFFTGNVSQNPWGYGFYCYLSSATALAPLKMEFCTVAGNMRTTGQHSYYSFFKPDGQAAASQFVIDGCAIADNGTTGGIGFPAAFADSQFITHTFASSGNYPETQYGNIACAADPCFVAAAEGDYRLTGQSPLKDAGGTAAPWMSAAKDVGTGYGVASPSGPYGVAVAFPEARRRLDQGVPDIGCFEHFTKPGLMLLLR